MLISDLLIPAQIKLDLLSTERIEAIHEVASLVEGNPRVLGFQGFYDELLAREKLDSTCLGNEIAFPHARTDHLKGMVLAIGRSPVGIHFESSDHPIRLIFVIGTPKRMATDYLSIVGGLARVVKMSNVRRQLLVAATPDEVVEIMVAAEKTVS